MTGEAVARQIITALSIELGIASYLVVASMRDCASVNEVAMRTVSILYNQIIDVGCYTHSLDHVGEHKKTPILDEFSTSWIGSVKAWLSWRTQTGLTFLSYSPTRWWIRYEVLHQVVNAFDCFYSRK